MLWSQSHEAILHLRESKLSASLPANGTSQGAHDLLFQLVRYGMPGAPLADYADHTSDKLLVFGTVWTHFQMAFQGELVQLVEFTVKVKVERRFGGLAINGIHGGTPSHFALFNHRPFGIIPIH